VTNRTRISVIKLRMARVPINENEADFYPEACVDGGAWIKGADIPEQAWILLESLKIAEVATPGTTFHIAVLWQEEEEA
jgi:hypothetical protein